MSKNNFLFTPAKGLIKSSRIKTQNTRASLLRWAFFFPEKSIVGLGLPRGTSGLLVVLWVVIFVLGYSPFSFAQSHDAKSAVTAEDALKKKWEGLSPEQKKLMQERYHKWQSFSSQKKDLLRKRYEYFQNLPDPQKQKMKENWKRFKSLDATRREKLHERFKQWRRLSAQDKQKVRERHQQFKDLPPEKKKELRERMNQWEEMPPQQKQDIRDKVRDRKSKEDQEKIERPLGHEKRQTRERRPRR